MSEPTSPPRTVYKLIHFKIGQSDRGDPENAALDIKSIGTYRSVGSAEAAARRLRVLPGFIDWPDGFRVFPQVLDQAGWPDGFSAADADRSYWDWPTEEIVPT